MRKHKGVLRIGTSNIIVPGNKLTFPAEFHLKSRLHYYSSLFNTLEVNSSFYKVPMPSTFQKWSADVPENFQFTIKLWREVTHVKHLAIDPANVDLFLKASHWIGNKKGCMLIQFPGKITLEYYKEAEQLLSGLREQDPSTSWRTAIEFRSSTWYVSETFELLDEYGASLVLHDIPKGKNFEINKRAKFIYMRFHGPAGDYRGSYDDAFLQERSKRIQEWLRSGKDVYAYFNNSMGSAFENAMTLKLMNA